MLIKVRKDSLIYKVAHLLFDNRLAKWAGSSFWHFSATVGAFFAAVEMTVFFVMDGRHITLKNALILFPILFVLGFMGGAYLWPIAKAAAENRAYRIKEYLNRHKDERSGR